LPHRNDREGTMASDGIAADSDSRHVEALLQSARFGETEPIGRLLELYRNYLTVLATTQFDRRLRQRVSPSDIVQEAMLAAHRDFEQFNGNCGRQFLAWIRQILINCLHRAIETHLKTKMRDVRCEISIESLGAALDRSTADLAGMFADPAPSPSAPLRAQERAVAVANQLARLRPRYREVIIMRNLQGLSFDEIAARVDRNPGAVRMLWLRAMDKLKRYAQPID